MVSADACECTAKLRNGVRGRRRTIRERRPHDRETFDVIIIDGQSRLRCVPAAVESRAGGVIILDNSDWFPRTSELLRTYDVIEVDMSGFGPINDYTSTTSFYFDRRFALKPRSERQPIPGIGSRPNSFDEAWWKPAIA